MKTYCKVNKKINTNKQNTSNRIIIIGEQRFLENNKGISCPSNDNEKTLFYPCHHQRSRGIARPKRSKDPVYCLLYTSPSPRDS